MMKRITNHLSKLAFSALILLSSNATLLAATSYTSPASGSGIVQNETHWDALPWTTSVIGGTMDQYTILPGYTLIVGSSPGNIDLQPKGDINILVQGRLGFQQGNGVIELTNGSSVLVDPGGVIGFPQSTTCCHGNAGDKITFAGTPVKKYKGPWYVTGPDGFTYTTEPNTSARWTGVVSSVWNNPNNWIPTSVPTSANNVLIPYPADYTNAPEVSNTGNQAKALTVMSASTLTINGTGTLTLNDSLHNFGNLTVKSGGAFVQTTTSKSCDYCPTGVFNIERDLSGETSPWYMGSPINTLSKSGFSSCGNAQFVPVTCDNPQVGGTALCVMSVNQDNTTTGINCSHSLWNTESSGNFVNGKGYSFYRSPSITNFSGQEVNNDLVTYGPLGYSNKGVVILPPAFGGTTTRGWHMISNPYPSPISLTAAQRTAMGFETQMQFWDSDLGWITPAPTGTVTVAVAQAFQVRVAGGVGATAIFTVDNSQRVATVGATFYKTDETSNYVNVTIGDGSYTNKTSIYFVDGATDAFDAAYDANRLFGLVERPYVYTIEQNGEFLSYNALASLVAGNSKSVPLSVHIGVNGTHTLTFDGIDAANATVVLEDLTSGNMYPVTEGYVHTFSAHTTDNANRFALHFNANAVSSITNILDNRVTMFPNPTAGRATIMMEANHGFNELQVLDINGKLVVSDHIAANENNKSFDISNLASGVYTVKLNGNNTITKKMIKQ
jgi:hypothetical protein